MTCVCKISVIVPLGNLISFAERPQLLSAVPPQRLCSVMVSHQTLVKLSL